MMTTKTIHGPNGLKLVLDPSQIFPDDPGSGTPAMVYRCDSRGNVIESATFWCAQGEGSLSDEDGIDVKLWPKDVTWLNSVEDEIEEMYATFDYEAHS